MGVFQLNRRIVNPGKRPWGKKGATLLRVFFQHRYSSLEDYDRALIDFLEDMRAEVDYADEVPDITFEDYDILIIGAPGDSWVSNHPEESRIQAAQCHVISFCRGTSRNALNLASSSTSSTVTDFILVNSHDHFTTEVGGDINCGPSLSTHTISDLSGDASLVYYRAGNTSSAGFAYRKPQEDQYYIHFGYHGIHQATDELKELLANTLIYLSEV